MSEIQNPVLHKLSLHAGGSHYPSINPQMQTAFAKLIIDQCMASVQSANIQECVRTSYDKDLADAVIARIVENIKQTFGELA